MQEMPAYKHWKNYGQPSDLIFASTTVIDFVHVFDTPESKDRLVRLIFSFHRRRQAVLHAYAVMANHIHIVTRLPTNLDAPRFLQQFKSNSGKFFVPRLLPHHKEALKWQVGLNQRSFWQAGFRSVVLERDMFWQKVEYTHLNPVRASLVAEAAEYRWSSARVIRDGLWNEESGLMGIPSDVVLPPGL